MSVDVNDFIHVRVSGSADNQEIENDFYYHVESTTAPRALSDLGNAFISNWQVVCDSLGSQYAVNFYSFTKLGDAQLYPLLADPGAKTSVAYIAAEQYIVPGNPTDDVGAVTTSPLPTFCAMNVRKACGGLNDRTATPIVGGPKIRGSWRYGTFAEAQTSTTPDSGDWWDADLVSTMQDNSDNFITITTVAPANYEMVVLHTEANGLADVDGGSGANSIKYAVVTSVLVSPLVSSQVSRKRRFRFN